MTRKSRRQICPAAEWPMWVDSVSGHPGGVTGADRSADQCTRSTSLITRCVRLSDWLTDCLVIINSSPWDPVAGWTDQPVINDAVSTKSSLGRWSPTKTPTSRHVARRPLSARRPPVKRTVLTRCLAAHTRRHASWLAPSERLGKHRLLNDLIVHVQSELAAGDVLWMMVSVAVCLPYSRRNYVTANVSSSWDVTAVAGACMRKIFAAAAAVPTCIGNDNDIVVPCEHVIVEYFFAVCIATSANKLGDTHQLEIRWLSCAA